MSVIKIEDPYLEEMVRRLVAGFQPHAIYLFGSRARGDNDPDSDYDLLMVLPGAVGSCLHRAQDAQRLLADVNVPKEVVVLSQGDFEYKLDVPASLPATVAREGLAVYEA